MTSYGFIGYFYTNKLPNFMKHVLNIETLDSEAVSLLLFYLFTIISSFFADRCIQTKRFSTTNVRKFFTGIAFLIPSICMAVLAFWNWNYVAAITLFVISLIALANSIPGFITSVLDFAPNFSGTIYGLSVIVFCLSEWLSYEILSLFLEENQGLIGWSKYFWISSGMCLFPGTLFLIFGKAHIQFWNFSEEKLDKDVELATRRAGIAI